MRTLTNERLLPSRAEIVFQVTRSMLIAARHGWRDTVLAVSVPALMLVLFSILGSRNGQGGPVLAAAAFPSIVGLTAMLGSNFIAVRVVSWRQLGIYQRLACTPTPLGDIVIGQGLAQAALSCVHAILVLFFGVVVFRLPLNLMGALTALPVLMLGAGCFIAYGMLIASLTRKPDTATALVMFTLLPMFFLSGVFPESFLPPVLRFSGSMLPASMLTRPLSSLMADGVLSSPSLWAVIGLAVYTVVFAMIAARRFRWE